MPNPAALELYAAKTSSAVIDLAARILSDGRKPAIGELAQHAGIAYAIAGQLRSFPIHAARRQLYVPLEVMQRHNAQTEDVFAAKPTFELRAALAEMRLHARKHLAAARTLLDAMPAAVAPAVLPVALVRPSLARMERRRYEPSQLSELAQWRRQWILWRAARSGLKRAL
jgi:phytoene synthase